MYLAVGEVGAAGGPSRILPGVVHPVEAPPIVAPSVVVPAAAVVPEPVFSYD